MPVFVFLWRCGTTLAMAFSFFRFLDHTYPRRYPYFDVVVGLAWSHDPNSYAGGSVCYW
jgi:hypothetical protein